MTTDPHKIEFLNKCRVRQGMKGYNSTEADGMNGVFMIPFHNGKTIERLGVIASDGEGWEHVSVTRQTGPKSQKVCPSWEEMCRVKRAFWDDEETVVEFHVPMAEWVNEHPGCLHLWKKVGYEFPRPPSLFVGMRTEEAL